MENKAKEKAKEIFDKHLPYVEAFTARQQDENAKQCAIICIEELIKDTNASSPFEEERLNFWKQVLAELKQMESSW